MHLVMKVHVVTCVQNNNNNSYVSFYSQNREKENKRCKMLKWTLNDLITYAERVTNIKVTSVKFNKIYRKEINKLTLHIMLIHGTFKNFDSLEHRMGGRILFQAAAARNGNKLAKMHFFVRRARCTPAPLVQETATFKPTLDSWKSARPRKKLCTVVISM